MSSGSWPNFNAWLDTAWGSGADFCWIYGYPNATNLVFGQNPPWALNDFLSVYPKFFGAPTTISPASYTNGSQTLTLPIAGLSVGTFLVGPGLASNTIITAVQSGTVTVNNAVLSTQTNATITAYLSPVVPTAALLLYVNLANASLQFARWQDNWYIGMNWFVAHYATLYARSDAAELIQTVQSAVHGEIPAGTIPGTVYTLSAVPPGGVLQSLTKNGVFQSPSVDYTLTGQTVTLVVATQVGDVLYAVWPTTATVSTMVQPTATQVAAQGLANGIQTSKSVGDVSASYSVLTSLENWGAWNLTLYGQQLATMAQVIGMGPMVIW